MKLGLALLALGVVTLVVTLHAQTTCQLQRIEGYTFGVHGQAMVPAYGNEDGMVPPGEVWKLKAGGVFTYDGRPHEYMLQVQHKVFGQGDICCWLPPIAHASGSPAATPVLGLPYPLILEPGESLQARTVFFPEDPNVDERMGTMWVGWKLAASDFYSGACRFPE